MTKPNKNQKTISKEEREKILEGSKENREQLAKDKVIIAKVEKEIFEKEKANLPLVLKEKIDEIETILQQELGEYVGLKSARIYQLISRQTFVSGNTMIGYTPKELFIVFDAYKRMIDMINKYTLFMPSLKNFCAFAGFTVNTFQNHLHSTDEEKRNVAQMISDYISDVAMDSAKTRKVDAYSTIFEMKAVHKMVEATEPIQIHHTSSVNTERIKQRIQEINKGKVIEGEFIEKD